MNSQWLLSFGVASNNLGNLTRGTDRLRPSCKITVRASSVQETSTARASLLSTKVGIPLLQKQISVFAHELSNHGQLMAAKATIRRQPGRIKPEFCVTPGLSNINMCGSRSSRLKKKNL